MPRRRDGRRLKQLALRRRVLRRAPALRGAGPGRAGSGRPSGSSGIASGASFTSTRGCACPARAARSGARAARAVPRRDWAGEPGAPLVDHVMAEGVRVRLRFGEGEWVEAVCPTPRATTSGPASAPTCPSNATCASATGAGSSRRAASRTSRLAITLATRSGTGRRASARSRTAARSAGTSSSGINDPPQRSERAIWIDGAASEPGPVEFDGLDAIDFDDGARLDFDAETERIRSENRMLDPLRVPAAVRPLRRHAARRHRLSRGLGVMEHHDAHW